MKNLPLILSIVSVIAVIVLAFTGPVKTSAPSGSTTQTSDTTAHAGAIVYFNMDRVLNEYDMANDLRSVVETKVNSISQEVTRRGNKLEKDINDFQDKINKGLLTQSVAENRNKKLIEQQNSFQTYANQKQQEIAEEQQVMMNQIADAINTFLVNFNAEKKYALILATQGDILPMPVVTGEAQYDITDAILEGLNAEYVKTKGKNKAE